MYKVSIIIPVFNGEKTLAETLNSVVSQPIFSQCEIIIVNDGSIDSTEDLCVNYCKKYSNIRLYKQENMGVSVARNHGIALAQGQYIMFLDADDFYVDNALSDSLLSILEKHYDLVLFSGYKSNITHDRYGIYMRYRDTEMKGRRVLPMPELFQAIIYRREMLLENDTKIASAS